MGDFTSILENNYLPGKSRQNIYNRCQQMCGKQSLAEYHCIKLDMHEVAKVNFEKFGVKYYRELSRIVEPEEIKLSLASNIERFEIVDSEVEVPFYRRQRDVLEVTDSIKYLSENADASDKIALYHPPVNDVESEIYRLKKLLHELTINEDKIVRKRLEYLDTVKLFQDLLVRNKSWSKDVNFEYKLGHVNIKMSSTNQYTFSGLNDCVVTEFIQPPLSDALNVDILDIDWDSFGEVKKRVTGSKYFNVLIIDAPWQFASGDPVRGAALKYKQVNDKKLMDIPLNKLVVDGFVMLWIVNQKEDTAKMWLKKYDFEVCDRLTWVKTNSKKHVVNSVGYHFLRCKEDVLIARRGNYKKHMKHLNFGKDVIMEERKGQSQKPVKLYEMIEETMLDTAELGELFGRKNNLRMNWITLGNQLGDNLSKTWLSEVKVVKQEL